MTKEQTSDSSADSTAPTTHAPLDETTRTLTQDALDASEARHRKLTAELETSNRRKDEFLAMLGHELRNPLQPIITTLRLMQLRQPDALAEERGIIESHVQHIAALVDDLMDVSRIARGKLELKRAPLNVGDIVVRAIDMTRPLLDEHEQTVEKAIADDLVVEGDRRRLIQVVTNLLTNAAKYSSPGQTIRISAGAEGGNAIIRVRDHGFGIDPDLLPRVFESFTQDAQSIDRSQGGLGLGLSIVQTLVRMHGGRVTAESDGRGKGSEFVVRLPLLQTDARQADAAHTDQPGTQAAFNGKGLKVLIVDDYKHAADSLAALLETEGFTIRVAYDGAEGVEVAADFLPVVALVDLGLPVLDGYEVARRLRATPGLEKTRIMAASGYGQERDRQRAREAGFDGHLVKPLDPAKIGKSIVQWAQEARASDNNR